MLFIYVHHFHRVDHIGHILGIIYENVATYVIQYLAGHIHTFYLINIYIFMDNTLNRRANTWILILNAFLASYFIGNFCLVESIAMTTVLLLVTSLLSTSNAVIGLLFQDRVDMEKDITRERIKGNFVTIASHELRNPLQALSFLITFLDSSYDVTKKQKEVIQEIKSTVELLTSIIDNILDSAKINSNKLSLTLDRMNLLECVERVASIYYPKAERKDIGLYVDVDPDIPCDLRGDVTRISQIISNFASNAVKFTETGRVIISLSLIAVDAMKATYKLSCNDSGVGISQEEKSILFQPFGQIQREGYTENKGWGLGLSISKDIVSLMGGKIEYETEPNIGSTFSFFITLDLVTKDTVRDRLFPVWIDSIVYVWRDSDGARIIEKFLRMMNIKRVINGLDSDLEIQPEDYLFIDQKMLPQYNDMMVKFKNILYIGEDFDPDARVMNQPIALYKLNRFLSMEQKLGDPSNLITKRSDLSHLRILVAEDNILIHRLELKLLNQNGITSTESAYNGVEALEKVQKNPPFDVILMDVQMPKLDGIQTTERIRALNDPVRSRTPIIVITGNTLFDLKKCLAIGANDVISKPVVFPKLLEAILKICK